MAVSWRVMGSTGSTAEWTRHGSYWAAAHKTATIYDPTMGMKATRSLAKVRSVPLRLSDHPVVIEVADGP